MNRLKRDLHVVKNNEFKSFIASLNEIIWILQHLLGIWSFKNYSINEEPMYGNVIIRKSFSLWLLSLEKKEILQ